MSSFVVLVMALAIAQSNSALSSAEEHTCPGTKDQRSLLSNMLMMTGYSDTCVAAALDECGTGNSENRYAPLIEEARQVVQQLSAAVNKLDSHLSVVVNISDTLVSAAANISDTLVRAAANISDSQLSVAANESEHQVCVVANQSESLPQQCKDLQDSGDSGSGMRKIYPYPDRPSHAVDVFCEHSVDGGGWTVFQRRTNAAVRENFQRGWAEYKAGFGDMTQEFWLGLDLLHQLTSTTKHQLRIDLEDYEGGHRHAKYGYFSVDGPENNYRLNVQNYSGNAGNSLAYHNGRPFSTRDADNDERSSGNCAIMRKGAWWYGNCAISNLNGYQYVGSGNPNEEGITWDHWKTDTYSLKRSVMMTRPAI